jgi:cell wall-associated NlpC family hydrolase
MPKRLRTLVPALAISLIACACTGAAPAFSVDAVPARSVDAIPSSAADRTTLPHAPPPPPQPTLGERAAKIALQAVGTPYRWGGSSLDHGFDCSGLVHWAYARLGLVLPHSSYALYDLGRPVNRSRMKPGDLLFFSGLGHVGVYLGRGRMVHAPHSGRRVEVVRLGGSYYGSRLVAARRLAPS